MDPDKQEEQVTTPDPAPEMTPEEKSGGRSTGATVGIVVVIALLVLGALYFWYSDDAGNTENQPTAEEIENDDQVTADLQNQSSSDDLEAIEADLQASEFNQIDSDTARIDQELEAEGQ